MDIQLDARQAYVAMYNFIKNYAERGGYPDEFVRMLASMTLEKNQEKTFDPAQWQDWFRAIEKALEDPNSASKYTEATPE